MFAGIGAGIKAIVKVANAAKLKPSLNEYIRMQQALAPSQKKLNSFNTATVAFDKTTGQYFYGVNKGFIESGNQLNSKLIGATKLTCAELQAVNSALMAGSKMGNLQIFTLGLKKGSWVAKKACVSCTSVLHGKVAIILSGFILF